MPVPDLRCHAEAQGLLVGAVEHLPQRHAVLLVAAHVPGTEGAGVGEPVPHVKLYPVHHQPVVRRRSGWVGGTIRRDRATHEERPVEDQLVVGSAVREQVGGQRRSVVVPRLHPARLHVPTVIQQEVSSNRHQRIVGPPAAIQVLRRRLVDCLHFTAVSEASAQVQGVAISMLDTGVSNGETKRCRCGPQHEISGNPKYANPVLA